MNILIVDDSPEDRYTYRRLLRSQSRIAFSFLESELGEPAMNVCLQQKPDCVLLDYRLPDLNGVEFITELRATPGTEGIAVIVLTRQGSEEIAVQALKNGAQDYLLKDHVSTETLVHAVENAIEKAGLIVSRNRAEQALRDTLDRLEQQVQERTAELTRANRLKDEFLATLSHELRTPLNAILGWVILIREGQLPPERSAAALETIERNARAQARLIEDLLDVSRIISGKFSMESVEIELNRIVDAAVEVVRPVAESKQLRLQIHTGCAPIHVTGDAARLQQVVWNLLSNAIKFTREGGRIEVRLEKLRERASLRVIDDGQGIDPAFLPYLFERFRQADGSITRVHGGLGLGLAIARHIVELHGGSISAASDGRDRGSTFTIDLPAA